MRKKMKKKKKKNFFLSSITEGTSSHESQRKKCLNEIAKTKSKNVVKFLQKQRMIVLTAKRKSAGRR